MLQKALQSEDYELASKFRDILKYQNKESNSDK
jgi:protein-arginine kinase activator protein McsA